MYRLDDMILRRPELTDVEALYLQKNDPSVSSALGGFSTGYSRQDLREWIERHRGRADEVIWVIEQDQKCVGHVGLYQIDFRARSAEFAVMVGDPAAQGRGVGRRCTAFALQYGFSQLNLNRISLQVLDSNLRAMSLYRALGFVEEGTLRQAQYKDGRYCDVIVMSVLREEFSFA